MQNVVDTWEGTSKATGGTLRSDKFYWYIIDYKDIGNRWIYRSINQLPRKITVKVSDSSRHHYYDWNQVK